MACVSGSSLNTAKSHTEKKPCPPPPQAQSLSTAFFRLAAKAKKLDFWV